MNDRSRLQELIAERVRLNNEIAKLKRTQYTATGIKVIRHGTGKMELKIRPDTDYDGQFRTIVAGYSMEALIAGAKRIIGRLNTFCEKSEEQIEEMMING